jgi:hypothetical protein
VSESLIAQWTPDALLLGGKVDRVIPQTSHRCAAQGAIAARRCHVERTFSFESLAAESAQPVAGPYFISP